MELLANNMDIPIGWVLATIGTLALTIGGMGGAMWAFMLSRLRKQDEQITARDKTIADQAASIKHLEEDVERLSKGCGINNCVWAKR